MGARPSQLATAPSAPVPAYIQEVLKRQETKNRVVLDPCFTINVQTRLQNRVVPAQTYAQIRSQFEQAIVSVRI